MISTDAIDDKILRLLTHSPLHPSELARKSDLHRTTINYRLQRLEKRNLIKHTTQGRKTIYSLDFKKAEKQNARKYVQEYSGENIIKAYRELLTVPRNSIILSAQGSGAVAGELTRLPHGFINEAHRIFKRKKILLKGFSNKKSLAAFDHISKELIRSHIGRSLGIKILDKDIFTGNGEILAAKNLFVLANPGAKKAIVVKEKEIARTLYDLMSVLFEFLEKTPGFDLNTYLKETYLSD
jgi:DNA-binding Lrp family transcriptional regulator